MFKDTIARLGQLARAPGASFPVHDGTKDTLGEHGVAYYLVPRERRVEDSSWFESTVWAMRRHKAAVDLGNEPPRWDNHDVLLLVHWPMLLRTALTTWPYSPVRRLAHELLFQLRAPLIEQYDVVLAQLVQRFRENWLKRLPEALDMPLFFGQESELDEQRFNAHLAALLANKHFRQDLDATMQQSLKGVTAQHLQLRLGFCPATHVKGVPCAACEENRWVRRYTSLLWVNQISGVQTRSLFLQQRVREIWPDVIANPWLHELRYLLSCVLPEEGVVRTETVGFGEAMLVDFGRVMQLRRHDGRRSSPFTPLDDAGTSDWWLLGAKARDVFAKATENAFLGRRPQSLKEMVTAQGWEWRETLDLPYELISTFAIANRVEHAKKSARGLALALKRLPSKRAAPNSKIKAVHLKYVDAGGREFAVTVIRRRKIYRGGGAPVEGAPVQNYYTTPFPVSGALLHYRNRRGVSAKIDGELYWTGQGLNRVANMRDEHGEVLYPWATHFCAWTLEQDAVIDRARFNKLRYEERYGVRLLRYQEGKQAHIGRFTKYEDETVLAFFLARPADTHRMSREEWAQLLSRLPGRTEQGVTRRLEELGKEYARKHGYAKYAASGLCLRRSVERRKRWLKEGVPV